MIHQFFDYGIVKKEGFVDSDETGQEPSDENQENDETIDKDEKSNEKSATDNAKLYNDVKLLIKFYLLFILFFMVSGSIMFKYIIMTRMCKSIVGKIPGFPDNLNYRVKDDENYDNFFSGGEEALNGVYHDCGYFTYPNGDEKDQSLQIPIELSFDPYYNNWLYRNDFTTGIPGVIYSLDNDKSINPIENVGPISDFLINIINSFWKTFTTIFIGMNNIFSKGISALFAILFVLLMAMSNASSLATKEVEGGGSTSIFSIIKNSLSPLTLLFYFPIFILSFSALFWGINIINYYEDDRMHLYFSDYDFVSEDTFGSFWINWIVRGILIFIMFIYFLGWLAFIGGLIMSQVLPFFMFSLFIICIFCKTYGKYTYNGFKKDLTFSNIIIELLPIYCFTNRWIIFFMLLAFVLIATAINPTIGIIVFICMFFGSFIFYGSIGKMIKNILSKMTSIKTPNEIIETPKPVKKVKPTESVKLVEPMGPAPTPSPEPAPAAELVSPPDPTTPDPTSAPAADPATELVPATEPPPTSPPTPAPAAEPTPAPAAEPTPAPAAEPAPPPVAADVFDHDDIYDKEEKPVKKTVFGHLKSHFKSPSKNSTNQTSNAENANESSDKITGENPMHKK